MPEPWSGIAYGIRPPRSRNSDATVYPTGGNMFTSSDTSTAHGESTDTDDTMCTCTSHTSTSRSSYTSGADSESTQVPVLEATLSQMRVNDSSHARETSNNRSSLYNDPYSYSTNIGLPGNYGGPVVPPAGTVHRLQRMGSFYSNPIAVAASQHPVLLPVPPQQLIPICDGSCGYYNTFCPMHNPAVVQAGQFMASYFPSYL